MPSPALQQMHVPCHARYSAVARLLLHRYGGYECKEPEPGKFTLVFRHLDQAVLWSSHLQSRLLTLKWPAKLMALCPDCQEVCRGAYASPMH